VVGVTLIDMSYRLTVRATANQVTLAVEFPQSCKVNTKLLFVTDPIDPIDPTDPTDLKISECDLWLAKNEQLSCFYFILLLDPL
jgi:hypothetical protein